MKRIGVITQLHPQSRASVTLTRHTACGDCGACQLSDDRKQITAIAKNTVDAVIGDTVSLEIPQSSVMSAALLAYVLPLGIFTAGIFTSILVFRLGEGLSLLLSAALLIPYYTGIRLFEKRLERSGKYDAVITSKLASQGIIQIDAEHISHGKNGGTIS